jgi:hypothetical protein
MTGCRHAPRLQVPASSDRGGMCHVVPSRPWRYLEVVFFGNFLTGGLFWKYTRAGGPLCQKFKYLMHAKYMHELCSLLMHIPRYHNFISYYNHDLQ